MKRTGPSQKRKYRPVKIAQDMVPKRDGTGGEKKTLAFHDLSKEILRLCLLQDGGETSLGERCWVLSRGLGGHQGGSSEGQRDVRRVVGRIKGRQKVFNEKTTSGGGGREIPSSLGGRWGLLKGASGEGGWHCRAWLNQGELVTNETDNRVTQLYPPETTF